MPDVLADVEAVLIARRASAPEGSYSATLLGDPERATRKLMEEAYEVCWELGREEVDTARAASEAADLVFHLLAALVGGGVAWAAVEAELAHRRAGGVDRGAAGPPGETS